ncbi:hypothetical protein WOLCODRAFT_19939 [Wolfiporia cocos MD-104 SS10]|uniref:Uncharacterized protein n=1 Tax=Wolfiporia cocos (strain MD-104) TaxID=742152 RepID=A0A2H3JCG8_WOLCO|nr:hypothetical protein WOLCODRAFT_19939 [Wolfiporia cocos MD-104 SS10]
MVYPPESMFDDFVDVRSLVGGTTAATLCRHEIIRASLYGISCAQVLYYFWHYTEDHFLFKTLALWGYATKQFAQNSSWYCTATYNSSLFYDCYPLTQQASNWMPSTGPPDVRVAAESHLSAPVLSPVLFSAFMWPSSGKDSIPTH